MSPSPIGASACVMRALLAAFLFAALSAAASAQPAESPPSTAPQPQPEMRENCPGLISQDRRPVFPAALKLAALGADQVRLTFVGHSSFLIESPQGVRIVTDYNDYRKPMVIPDIITMNHAHDTHFTDHPDPAIKYVLRGWGPTPRSRRSGI